MNSAHLIIFSLFILAAGYFFYGRFLSRVFGVDPSRKTPAHEKRDGVDFVPANHWLVLFGHHFSSICGAGPIVGPVIAVAYWGWGVSLIWILIGRCSRLFFSIFIWLSLILVIAVFAILAAKTFNAEPTIVVPSLGIIPLALVVGWLLYVKKFSLSKVTFLGIAILALILIFGRQFPVVWSESAGVNSKIWIKSENP